MKLCLFRCDCYPNFEVRTVLRMESNNENKQDVMVSNLPLLFSDGNPTNIDHMSAVIEKI